MTASSKTDTKMGHTAGPFAFDAERGELYADDGDVCPLIATVNFDNVGHDQALADGLLLAAAPTLLADLIEIVDRFECALEAVHATKTDRALIRRARKTIAKTEGRS